MEETDIIGKGKYFEPPFKVRFPRRSFARVIDSQEKIVAECGNDDMAEYICNLLNREHNGKG